MAEAVAAVLLEVGSFWAADAAVTLIGNAALINATVAIAASSAYGAQQRRKARAAYNASLKDRELMIRSGIAPRRVIYGRDKISGPVVYAEATGDKGQYLHLVVALAAHECDAIEEIYFNDVLLPTPDAGGFITSGDFAKNTSTDTTETLTTSAGGTVTLAHATDAVHAVVQQSGTGDSLTTDLITGWSHTPGSAVVSGLPVSTELRFGYEWAEGTPLVRIRKHLGGSGQVADADLVAESAGAWTSAHIGAGICYLAVRLEYDQDVFGQVGLPAITAVVRGRKVYDPRTSTTAWSDNPALCVADWVRDTRYGLGATANEVPDAEVIAAANICEELVDLSPTAVTWPTGGPAHQQARYACNGSFTTEQSPRDVLSDLLSAMAGNCVWSQGRWLVRAGAYRTPSSTLTADDLAGRGVSIVPKASRSELFNSVRVTHRDPLQAWGEVQAPLVTNATYESADGGVRIVRSIQMPGAMDAWRAQRLAKIELERARQALTVQLTTNLCAYDLSPTDTVALTLDRYGFAAKVFEVVERTWSAEGTIAYTLRETAAGVWSWNYGEATTVDLAPDTTLPSPYAAPETLADLTVASGTAHLMRLSDGTIVARAWLSWTVSTEAFVVQGGRIDVQWRLDTATDWQPVAPLPGDATGTYVEPMPDERVVLFRVRPVNASGRAGAWSTIADTITGKSAAPSNVAGLAYTIKPSQVVLQWTMCTDIDYAATELRIGASWAAGTLLWVGASREYQHPRPANGTYTVWAAHQDSSGHYSATPASIAVTVDDSIDPTSSVEGVYVEWSIDGSTAWHSTYATGDLYARWKTGTAGAWQGPFKAVGEDGTAGEYLDFVFKRASTIPATPTGNTPAGWSDAPPAADGNPLWASTATKTAAGVLVGVWSTPVRIDGSNGTNGTNGTNGANAQTLALTATGFAFAFADVAATSSSSPSIVFTAALQNVSGTVTFAATAYNAANASLGTATLTSVTATSATLTAANFVALGATTVRYIKVVATLGALSDTMTIYRGDNGSDAIQSRLTNEAHTLQAATDGTVSSYTGCSGTMEVYKGTSLLSSVTTPSVSFALAPSGNPQTLTYSLNATTGAYAVTGIAAGTDSATLTFRATLSTGVTQDRVFSVAKSKTGAAGTAAQSITLSATGFAFIFADALATSATTPASIVFTGNLQTVTGTVAFTATAYNAAGTSLGSVPMTVASPSATMTAAQFVTWAGTRTVRVTASIASTNGTGTLSDTMTIYRGDDGSDAINLVLGNEAHTVPTASDGAGGDFTGANSTVRVYEGTTDVTSLWTLTSAVTSVGGTFNGVAIMPNAVSGASTPSIVVTSLSADTGSVTITATRTSYPTQTKVMTLSRAKAGVTGTNGTNGTNGASAQTLALTATGFAFAFADAAATSSASPPIVFAAMLQNVSGTVTFAATAYNAANVSLGTATLTSGTATSATLTAANFVALGATTVRYIKVFATLGALSDMMTIYRGDGGSNAIQCVLTNEAHTLPAASDDTVSSYVGSGTGIRVFEGVTELDFDGIGSANGRWTASRAVTTGTVTTPGAISESVLQAVVADHAGMTTDVATITYTISGKSATGAAFAASKVQTLTKSKAGATGATGATGGTGSTGSTGQSNHRVYKAAAYGSAPTTPSTTTSGATPAGWSPTPVTIVAGEAQWQSDGTTPAGSTTTTWSAPYQSYLKVAQLSALTADLGTMTAGDITGTKIRTAASGSRISLNDTSQANQLRGYSGSNEMFRLDATNGRIYAWSDHAVTTLGAGTIQVDNTYGGTPGDGNGVGVTVYGSSAIGVGGLASGSGTGVYGKSSSGVGVKAESASGNALQVVGPTTVSGRITSTVAGNVVSLVLPVVTAKPTAIAGGIALHNTLGFIFSDGTNWYGAASGWSVV